MRTYQHNIITKTIYEAQRTKSQYMFVVDEDKIAYYNDLYPKFSGKFVSKASVKDVPVYIEKQEEYYNASYDIDKCLSINSHLILRGCWLSEQHVPNFSNIYID